MKRLLLFALCLALAATAAEPPIPPPWTELAPMLESDQQGRLRLRMLTAGKAADGAEVRALWDQQQAIDTANMRRLAELLDRHGWPPRDAGEASHIAFLIVQHAEPDQQQRYFPMMRAAQQRGDLSATELAMLEDRLLMREGKPQRYGSQLIRDADGRMRFHPIEDEAHVDERRLAVGLGPIRVYAAHFGLNYEGPATGPAKLPEGRCPALVQPDASALPAGDNHVIATFLLKADGSLEKVRVEGGSKPATQLVAHALSRSRCLPAAADQQVMLEFKLGAR